MNKVVISGGLTKDMEVVATKTGCLGKTTVAVKEGYGEKATTQYIDIVVFGDKRINGLSKVLLKGNQVIAEGKLNVQNFKNKEGQWKTSVNILVDAIEVSRFKKQDEQQAPVDNEDIPF